MKQIRTLGMALVAVLALSAVVASAAFAAAPEFVPNTTQGFTTSSKTAVLRGGENTITCKASSGTGEVTGAKTVGSVHVTFTGCKGKNFGSCAVKSAGASGAEEVVTDSTGLEGELGPVAGGKVGLDLKAHSGNFVTVEGSCLFPKKSEVTGSLIGEVKPVGGPAAKEGTLTYAVSGGKQGIQAFEGGSTDVLSVFGFVEATQETTETVKFTEAVEVS